MNERKSPHRTQRPVSTSYGPGRPAQSLGSTGSVSIKSPPVQIQVPSVPDPVNHRQIRSTSVSVPVRHVTTNKTASVLVKVCNPDSFDEEQSQRFNHGQYKVIFRILKRSSHEIGSKF